MFLLKNIQRCFFFLFVLDILFLGSGINIPGLGISSRKIFFGIFFCLSFIVYFCDFSGRGKIDVLTIIIAVLFLFAWVFFIPLLGEGNFAYAISDAMPLIALGVFLLTTDFSGCNNAWNYIRRILLIFLYGFSLLHVILYLIFLVRPDFMGFLQSAFAVVLDVGTGDDARYVFFTPLDGGGVRVYFGSSFLLLIGIYFLLSDDGDFFGRGLRSKIFFAALLVGALWATNTRSFMMGSIAMLLSFSIFRWLMAYMKKSWLTIFTLLSLPFMLIFLLIPTVDVEILQVFGLERGGSDDIRFIQLYPLMNAFLENYVFGLGFGASASFVRAEDAPYAYELSILALFMKIGLVGVMVACGIFATTLRNILSRESGGSIKKISAVYALYFSFIISCFYNPYIFGFFGTFFILFVLYEFSFLVKAHK